MLRTPDNRVIRLGGMPSVTDWRNYQGQGYDFYHFDEAAEFTETQVRSLLGWLRTSDPSVRVQALLTFNPPTTLDGRWIIAFFAPWLDPSHPNPAQPGELRWFVRGLDDTDIEVDGPDPITINGVTFTPISRTFIPARVTDNPYLMETGYVQQLQALPEPLRSQLLLGDFRAGINDDPWQVVPSAWIEDAMRRWEHHPQPTLTLSALGIDVAEGGRDTTVLCERYQTWIAPLTIFPGSLFADGFAAHRLTEYIEQLIAGRISRAAHQPQSPAHTPFSQPRFSEPHRLPPIIIDVIGHGVGGGAYALLQQAGYRVFALRGDAPCRVRGPGNVTFANVRSWLFWNLRVHLDPATPEHYRLLLPPDRRLLAELASIRYSTRSGAIAVESKRDAKSRLGHSPDTADALAYACMPQPNDQPTVRDLVFA